jgi:hypothetical protein
MHFIGKYPIKEHLFSNKEHIPPNKEHLDHI